MRKEQPKCFKSGKKTYLSEAAASRKVYQWDGIKRYYYCEHCQGYHLTSKTREEQIEEHIKRGKLNPVEAFQKVQNVNFETISMVDINKRIKELTKL